MFFYLMVNITTIIAGQTKTFFISQNLSNVLEKYKEQQQLDALQGNQPMQ